MTSSLVVRLLGAVQLEHAGAPLRGLQSRKAVGLLCYLAVRREPIARATLAALFWPKLSEARALVNLTWSISHLSSHLPGCLQADRHVVAFQPGAALWLDLEAFAVLRRQDNPAAWEAALALYRGEFMDGFYINGCSEFELWLVRERERYQQEVSRLLEALLSHKQRVGDYHQGIALAQRLLLLDPLREETHQALIALLALDGQRNAALAQYEQCRRILEQELGVEPSEELVALYREIHDGADRRLAMPAGVDLRAAPPPPDAPRSRFFGRVRELELLAAYLDDPAKRLISVVGPGGIGKTRLVLEFARQRQALLPGAMVLVQLAAVGSGEGLTFAIADALKLSFGGAFDPRLQLIDALASRQLLLVLDNVEHLLSWSSWLLECLYRAPQLKLLVTSRERLNLQLEHVIRLEGLEIPDDEASLSESDALQLFAERARRSAPGFRLVPELLPSVARICRAVEGMPLGIELAAALVDRMSCAAIAEAIPRNIDLLSAQSAALAERHRNLRAVFNHSRSLLSAEEQRALQLLAVFHGRFTAAAAEQICQVNQALLDALWNKSLLQSQGGGFYDFHELLRQYSRELLAESAQPELWRRRHASYYSQVAEPAAGALEWPQQQQWLARFEQEPENFRAALAGALELREPALALRLAWALWPVWELRGYLAEGTRWLEQALELAVDQPGQADLLWVARCQQALGALLANRGLIEPALALLELTYASFEALESRRDLCVTSGLLGYVRLIQAAHDQAQRWIELQQQLALELELRGQLCVALNNMGRLAFNQGQYQQALACWERGLEAATLAQDYPAMTRLTISVGVARELLGSSLQAFESFLRGIELMDTHGFRMELPRAIGNLGTAYALRGMDDEAQLCFESALGLALEMGNRMLVAWTLCWLGQVASHQRRYQQSEQLFVRAIDIQRVTEEHYFLCLSLAQYADCLIGQERLEEAEQVALEALEIARRHGLRSTGRELLAELYLLRIQTTLGRMATPVALARLEQLRAEWGSAEQQAMLNYTIWQIDPFQRDAREEAARGYAELYASSLNQDHYERYYELVGQLLERRPPLPRPPEIVLRHLRPLDQLLAEIEQLGLGQHERQLAAPPATDYIHHRDTEGTEF